MEEEILEQLFLQIKQSQQLSDEILTTLGFVCQHQTLGLALDFLDRGNVTKVIAKPSGRSLFEVDSTKGRDHEVYFCLGNHYCSCPSFIHSVLIRKELLLCKHQLGARLAEALHKFKEKEINDEEYALYIIH